jgi:hypothetical protein
MNNADNSKRIMSFGNFATGLTRFVGFPFPCPTFALLERQRPLNELELRTFDTRHHHAGWFSYNQRQQRLDSSRQVGQK